jgi:glycerophosphoryl diester phosphodiesterase
VELDVHRCKSGELVVIHDDTVERTTNGSGEVAHMTFAQLRALTIDKTEHIPTLEEALDVLNKAYCFIEIKHDDAALLAAELMEQQIKNGYPREKLWLISFEHNALKAVRTKYPLLYIGASFEELAAASIKEAHAWGAQAVMPHYQSFGMAEIKEAHALGMKVMTWTVNEFSDIARLKAMHIDGIMGDYPDRL